MRDRIIFLVSSLTGVNTGIGGHYRSVKEISELLSSELDVHIITWGDVPSPVLQGSKNYTHLHTISPLWPNGIRGLREELERHQLATGPHHHLKIVTIGWMFSCMSAFLGSRNILAQHAHLKPGGDAARKPWLLNGLSVAVFHLKDLDVYQLLEPKRHIALVPGRVTPPKRDEHYLASATVPFRDTARVNIVTIMRIASDKRRPTLMIYNALKALQQSKVTERIAFTHLGTPQDKQLLAEIEALKMQFPSAIVIDSASTTSGPKYLHTHDAFVGIGRGVMEAMSLGMPTFIPVIHPTDGPVLCAVTESNWRAFFRENFTHRTSYSDLIEAGDARRIEECIEDAEMWQTLGKDSLSIYEANLSPQASLATWKDFLHRRHPDAKKAGSFRRLSELVFLEGKRLARKAFDRIGACSLKERK